MKNMRIIGTKLLCLSLILWLFPATVVEAKSAVWISELVFPAPRQVSSPASISLDFQRQRYYVVDSQEGRLLSFDSEGKKLGEFDAAGELVRPTAMTFARPGKMWVVERSDRSLLYIDMKTQKTRKFFPKGPKGGHLFPDRIATDKNHRLYVSDRLSGRVYALDDNLKIAAVFAPQAGGQFVDFKIRGNRLWALEQRQQTVYSFKLDGRQEDKIALQYTLDTPVSLEIGEQQQLYVLDRAAARVYHFTSRGEFMDVFGQGGYRRGQLRYPAQLVLDWQQRLCIVNQGNDRIEVFSH
jgi:sugar lactone lactonase YvrE